MFQGNLKTIFVLCGFLLATFGENHTSRNFGNGKCNIYDREFDKLIVLVEDLLSNHIDDRRCGILFGADQAYRDYSSSAYKFLKHFANQLHPIGVYDATDFALNNVRPTPDNSNFSTTSGDIVPWPHTYYNKAIRIQNCMLVIMLSTTAEPIEMNLDEASRLFYMRAQTDYFVFWLMPMGNSKDGDKRTEEALLNQKPSMLRFKMVKKQNSNNPDDSTLHATHFYLNNGFPVIVDIGRQIGKLKPDFFYTEWTGKHTAFPDFTKNLQGKFIRSTFFFNVSLEMLEESIKNDVLMIEFGVYILKILGETMNFTWLVLAHELGEGGAAETQLDDGTWLGFVGTLMYNKSDFSIGTMVTYSALHRIEYSFVWVITSVVFTTAQPKSDIGWDAVFMSYSSGMWLAVGLSIFFCSFLLLAFLRLDLKMVEPPNPKKKYTIKGQYLESFEFLLFAVMDMCPDYLYKSSFSRVFIVFWLLYALIVNTAYQSKLLSLMTYPRKEELPDYFEELIETDFEYAAEYRHNIFFRMVLEHIEVEAYKTLLKKIKSFDKIDQCLEQAFKRRMACLSLSYLLPIIQNLNLDKSGKSLVRAAKEDKAVVYGASMWRTDFVSFTTYNNMIKRMFDKGVMYFFRRMTANQAFRHGLKNLERFKHDTAIGTNPLTVKHFLGAFLILSGGCFIATIIFASERITYCAETKKNQIRPVRRLGSSRSGFLGKKDRIGVGKEI